MYVCACVRVHVRAYAYIADTQSLREREYAYIADSMHMQQIVRIKSRYPVDERERVCIYSR